MTWTVIVNEVYPGYSTYIGGAGYGRHVAQIDKTNVPFTDQWILDTYKQEILNGISSEGKMPLWVVIRYQEYATLFYVEARYYFYDSTWAAPTQGTGVQWIPPIWLTPVMIEMITAAGLKILTTIVMGLVVWTIANLVRETAVVIWGPEGPEGQYPLSWILPTAALVLAGALFISAVSGIMRKGQGVK